MDEMKMDCDIICVTNRHLCKEDYRERLVKVACAHPNGIILREKDMSEEEYRQLAKWFLPICREKGTRLFLHYFYKVAMELKPDGLHLPLPLLENISSKKGGLKADKLLGKLGVTQLGASCHSLEDAIKAKQLGCTYILAGHIFDTDCKKGIPGRGIEFLKNITGQISVPVYAIGGITTENINEVRSSAAAGACIMSSAMECENVEELLKQYVTQGRYHPTDPTQKGS